MVANTYLDGSALVKLAVDDELGALELRDFLEERPTATSITGVVEFQRTLRRKGRSEGDALQTTTIVDLSSDVARVAGSIGSASLRTLDAIHIATAMEIGCIEFVTYDRMQGREASSLGLRVYSPGVGQ